MLWLEIKLDIEKLAPALHLMDAIGLPDRRTLGQWQATCLREQCRQVHGFEINREVVFLNQRHEPLMAHIAPRGNDREIVIDGSGHDSSGDRENS